jgi:Flp pilus assembly pilin Flp
MFMDLRDDQDGATTVEYGLMLALIAVLCLIAVGSIGRTMLTMYDDQVVPSLQSAVPGIP